MWRLIFILSILILTVSCAGAIRDSSATPQQVYEPDIVDYLVAFGNSYDSSTNSGRIINGRFDVYAGVWKNLMLAGLRESTKDDFVEFVTTTDWDSGMAIAAINGLIGITTNARDADTKGWIKQAAFPESLDQAEPVCFLTFVALDSRNIIFQTLYPDGFEDFDCQPMYASWGVAYRTGGTTSDFAANRLSLDFNIETPVRDSVAATVGAMASKESVRPGSLSIQVGDVRRIPYVRYSVIVNGGDSREFVILSERERSNDLAIIEIIIKNDSGQVISLTINNEAATAVSTDGRRYAPIDPIRRALQPLEPSNPLYTIEGFLPIWGSVELQRRHELRGYLVFDLDKNTTLNLLEWSEIDPAVLDLS